MNLLDFLFPRTCLGCGKTGLSAEASDPEAKVGQYFCPSCIPKINIIDSQICPDCEKPSPFGQTHRFCQKKYSLDGLISFFAYEGMIRKAIHQLKFKFVTDLSDELFKLMLKRMENEHFSQIKRFITNEKPIVTSVPLYWYKENQRGFNQSEIFAQKLAKFWNLKFKKDLLIRSKFTQSQYGLNQEQRKENLQNALKVNPNYELLFTNYLIIDDIWTTGSTLKTCGSILKKSGAKAVWGLTIAR